MIIGLSIPILKFPHSQILVKYSGYLCLMQQQRKAYLYALAAIFFWATIGSAFKLSLRHMNFVQLLFYATFISLFVIGTVLVLQHKVSLLRTLTMKDVAHSALLGLFNPFLYYMVLLKAYSILQAQEAVALNYIWPVMLVDPAILGAFESERSTT